MLMSMPSFFHAEICTPTVLSSFEGVSSTMFTAAGSGLSQLQVPSVGGLSFPVRIPPSFQRPVIAPPPPYAEATTINATLVPPPPYSTICHDAVSDVDVDVVSIIDEARDVCLSDEEDDEHKDQPLDLSVRKKEASCSTSSCSSSSTQSRPSVIRNGYVGRNTDMRRSASSVSARPVTEPDVSEHFRRSLSGKWPRRQTNHAHYTPPQTEKEKQSVGVSLQRKNSQSAVGSPRRTPPSGVSPPQQIIVNNSGIEIEDHFRKALGAEAYELLRQSRRMNLA